MDAAESRESLWLQGGPLHRLGCRLGLVRHGSNSLPLGLTLGLLLWGVLVVLATVEGDASRVFSLAVIAGHVRLLVAIPLFFLCEAWLAPRLTLLVRELVRSEVVPPGQRPALDSALARVARGRDSWLAEAACLAVAVAATLLAPYFDSLGASARPEPGLTAGTMPLAGWWYWFVCLTVFRFLAFRWAWRLALEWYLLWRISRLELRLIPTHPDRVGGLGYFDVMQIAYMPLVAAIASIQSAILAEDLAAGRTTISAVYPAAVLLLLVLATIFVAPLLVFAPKLWECRARGLADYGELGARYVAQFDGKWVSQRAPPGEPLLGTADIQSLADLANSVAVVREMSIVPVSRRLMLGLGLSALLPFLPLLFFEFQAADLASKLLSRLLGL